MPGLAPSERFGAILCLDHAIGLQPRERESVFLRRMRGALSDGGLLLVGILHRDFFAVRSRPFSYHVVGNVEQHEFRSYDPVSGILNLVWKFYERDGEDLRFRGTSSRRLTLLAPDEAKALLEAGGWRVEAVYGGWNREAVSADRREVLLVARTPARR